MPFVCVEAVVNDASVAFEYDTPVGDGKVNCVFAKNLKLPESSNTAIDSDGSDTNCICLCYFVKAICTSFMYFEAIYL